MGRIRRQVGFWGSLGRLRLSDLVTWEILGGFLIGLVAAIALVFLTTPGFRLSLAGDYLSLTPALLGVVFASLALIVALMSEDYIKHLRATDGGVLAFLGPFMIVIGLQVGTLLITVGYRAFAALLPSLAENIAFGILTILFSVSTLEVISLARSVLMHALARTAIVKLNDGNDVASLQDRRTQTGGQAQARR